MLCDFLNLKLRLLKVGLYISLCTFLCVVKNIILISTIKKTSSDRKSEFRILNMHPRKMLPESFQEDLKK